MKKLYWLVLTALAYSPAISQSSNASVVPMEHGAKFQFVDKAGKVKVNDYRWDETESFVNGFAKVALDHKWGFVNLAGEPVIPPNFQSLRNFSHHLAAAMQNGKWGFIDEKGNTVIPFRYDIVYDFREDVTAVYLHNKWYLINPAGSVVRKLDIDVFWGFKNGQGRFTRQGQSGVMNTRGDILSTETISRINPNNQIGRAANVTSGTCPANIDFELGNFTNWTCDTGSVAAVNNVNVITVVPSVPLPNRHTLVPSTNPSLLDPYGFFPINSPNGSGYAVKLGNDINGAQAERLSYAINVPANAPNASITYRYAVVFQDPGHQTWEQPRFVARVLDVQSNTYLPCASYEYIATSAIPGFFNSTINDSIKCKDWASVYINLSKYQGRSLVLEFTTADCTRGGHWGYAYIDVGECDIAATLQYQCNPNRVELQAPPGFQSYKWYTSNFGTVLGTDSVLTINQPPPGPTTVHIVVTPYNGFGCGDTLHITYDPSFPVANAGPDKPLCPGISTSIGTPAAAGNTYAWSPKAYLSDSTQAMPLAHPPSTTTYTLTVYNANTGCTAIDSMVINLNPKPTPAFAAPAPQCLSGNQFNFVNNSSISSGTLSYQWDFGDGASSTQANPSHSYQAAGIYHVKLVATSSNGCKDSVYNNAVTVNSNPVVKTNNDLAICRGASAPLQTSGGLSYTWTPATALSCGNCANPIASPLQTTSYVVKGIDSYGCPGYDTIVITVNQPIQVDASPDVTICQKQAIDLHATGAASYSWSPSAGLNNTTVADPVASPASTTTYRVIGFDGKNCFTDTSYITITVNPKPEIELGPDLTLSTGTVHPLTSVYQNGPVVWWQWSPSTDLSCSNCPDPSATINKDITYHVAIRNSYGCLASDSIHISTFCEGSQVFIPNAFTPDGDGVNDVLMVRAKGISSVKSFRIFNRWGEMVFERTNFQPNDPANGWDGRIRGVAGPAEVYVYTAEVICSNLQTYLIKGNTSILK